MSDAPVKIQIALVSHTNNAKPTLARTLLGHDVGEVRDAAHVTVFAESHVLLNTKHVELEETSLLKSTMKVVSMGKGGAQQRQEKVMNILVARPSVAIGQATAGLLALHKLDFSVAGKINARVCENVLVRAPIDQAQAGLLGAVIFVAAAGLLVDLMAGGLTLDAGALLGSIVGVLTFACVAWRFNSTMDRHQAGVQFSDAFLGALAVAAISLRARGPHSGGVRPSRP